MSLVPGYGGLIPLAVPPVDVTKALNQDDLTRNLDCNVFQCDTMAFSSFARAIQQAKSLIFRTQQGGPEEIEITQAFLRAEGLLHEHGKTDPRMPYVFAGFLTDLDEYDYALECLKNLEAVLAVPSTAVSLAISEVQQSRARRVRESHQALSQLNPSTIGWAYSAASCAPLPDILAPIHVPIIEFTPFTLNCLSQNELGRLLRAISVHTNVVEGVLDLSAVERYNLIYDGFDLLVSTRDPDDDPSYQYIQQVLLDSQTANQLSLSRNSKLDDGFVRDLHKLFTKTACIASQRAGSVYIGRGKFKFLSNHVFARNSAYHIFCPPEEVAAEMEKLFGMLKNYLIITQDTPENGIWLAAWFHHRFVNIHPFRDGNGRVTRALVSAILVRFGLLPLLVTVDDKDEYFRALMAADADGSNLLPLAKFIASRQLNAFFLCKTQQPPSLVQDRPVQSEFRRRRIEEAHLFIQQKVSEISAAYNKTVERQSRPPGPSVHLVDCHTLEVVQTGVALSEPQDRIYLIYGSLFPLETDIFALYILTPTPQSIRGSVRGLTGVLYSEAADVWESRLEQFLMSDLDDVLKMVTTPK